HLLDDSRIYSLYVAHKSSTLPIIDDLIALRIFKGPAFNRSYANHFITILNASSDTDADRISDIILYYGNYGQLLLLSKYFEEAHLFRQIIFKMFDKVSPEESVNIVDLVNEYSSL